jgi:hypothetical protein
VFPVDPATTRAVGGDALAEGESSDRIGLVLRGQFAQRVLEGQRTIDLLPGLAVELPLLSSADRILHVGRGASFDQRLAFDLGLLRGVAGRDGDHATADACTARIAQLQARRTAGLCDDRP